ncbi:hypothetical protein FB45DRAFT_211603 [Roridomyces roridus]|uniref:F-box domain-containing protein n=1 Tax=Roridomyces roridus TaxID=1738132 RepID=A0AAD7CGD3_9AGAR|nr:hypothetical protein FB45DRAFT_211603 [Roridomyces roridus]
MHPALSIAELVDIVCEKLKEPEGDNRFGFQGTLASLAVTSRAFQEPALDALWSSHCGIHNIIKCLPSHLWETQPDTHILTFFTRFSVHIIGSIEAEDWTIALSYARRIKHLFMGPPLGTRFPDVAVFETVFSSLPSSQRLCPNLRFLDWGVEAETHLEYMNLFLSPRVKGICITISHFDIPIPSNLALQSVDTLRVLCPNAGNSEAYILCRSACDLIKQLDRIERLWVPNLDGETLQHLSGLPSLMVLNLDYGKVPFLSSGEAPLRPGFSALRKAHFSRALPDFIVNFLKLQSSGHAITEFLISIVPTHFEEAQSLWTLFAAMNTHIPCTSLKKIVVSMAEDRWLEWSYSMSVADGNINDLIPLFSFRNLVTVHLTLPFVAQIEDAMAMDMAVSWPKLRELVLMEPSVPRHRILRQRPPPRTTLNALLAFATHCRDLERLALQVDGSIAILAPTDGHFPEPQFTLRKFKVGSSPIGSSNVDSVAEFLGLLFPGLKSIQFAGDGFGLGTREVARTTQASWKMVQKKLREGKHVWARIGWKMIPAARATEARWKRSCCGPRGSVCEHRLASC